MSEAGHITNGGLTLFHIGDQKLSRGRLLRKSSMREPIGGYPRHPQDGSGITQDEHYWRVTPADAAESIWTPDLDLLK